VAIPLRVFFEHAENVAPWPSEMVMYPLVNQHSYWKWAIYSEFSHWKWWFP
jgi:hypothetical protein